MKTRLSATRLRINFLTIISLLSFGILEPVTVNALESDILNSEWKIFSEMLIVNESLIIDNGVVTVDILESLELTYSRIQINCDEMTSRSLRMGSLLEGGEVRFATNESDWVSISGVSYLTADAYRYACDQVGEFLHVLRPGLFVGQVQCGTFRHDMTLNFDRSVLATVPISSLSGTASIFQPNYMRDSTIHADTLEGRLHASQIETIVYLTPRSRTELPSPSMIAMRGVFADSGNKFYGFFTSQSCSHFELERHSES